MKYNNSIIIYTGIFLFLIISMCALGISIYKNYFTGMATNEGYVNLSILTSVNINMTRDRINWSSGSVNTGERNATLYTRGDNTGIADRGNWSGADAKAFVVENIGGVNCSIKLQTMKNAHDFFNSSTSSNEQYMWNISNKNPESCSGGATLGVWTDVNKTDGGTLFCSQFSNNIASNEIYIDILLTIPYDSQNTGEQSDILTVSADTAG